MAKKAKLVDVGGKPCLVGMEPSQIDRSKIEIGSEVEAWELNPFLLTRDGWNVRNAVKQVWLSTSARYFEKPLPHEKRYRNGSQVSDADLFYATEADAWQVAMNRFEAWAADQRELIRNKGVRK